MNTKQYVQSLGKGFSRRKLIETMLTTNRLLTKETLPSLDLFIERIPSSHFTKGTVGDINRDYMRDAKSGGKGKNMYEHISWVFTTLVERAGEVEDEINRNVSESDTADTLNYRGAILAQYVQILQFCDKYVRTMLLLHTALINDEQVGDKKTLSFTSGLSDTQINWLSQTAKYFFMGMRILGKVAGLKSIPAALDMVPDMVVMLTDEGTVSAVYKTTELDPWDMAPFGLVGGRARGSAQGFAPPAYSLIYHIRMAYTDWEIQRLEAAREDRQALEYRIAALSESIAGETNPRMEEVIAKHTERLMSVNAKIAKIEGSVHERT